MSAKPSNYFSQRSRRSSHRLWSHSAIFVAVYSILSFIRILLFFLSCFLTTIIECRGLLDFVYSIQNSIQSFISRFLFNFDHVQSFSISRFVFSTGTALNNLNVIVLYLVKSFNGSTSLHKFKIKLLADDMRGVTIIEYTKSRSPRVTNSKNITLQNRK